MMVIIETMVKLLLLMALGFFLNKLGIFSRESNRMLSDLIVKVTTPLLIISSVCETGGEELNRLSILPVLGGAFILYLALIAAGELIARLPFFPKTERDATACMLVFSNNSFMGIPVLESLRRMGQPRQVFLCLDNDAAGQTANQRMVEQIQSQFGISAEVLIPAAKDWNEELCAMSETPKFSMSMGRR